MKRKVIQDKILGEMSVNKDFQSVYENRAIVFENIRNLESDLLKKVLSNVLKRTATNEDAKDCSKIMLEGGSYIFVYKKIQLGTISYNTITPDKIEYPTTNTFFVKFEPLQNEFIIEDDHFAMTKAELKEKIVNSEVPVQISVDMLREMPFGFKRVDGLALMVETFANPKLTEKEASRVTQWELHKNIVEWCRQEAIFYRYDNMYNAYLFHHNKK